jgi:hypothetical protein
MLRAVIGLYTLLAIIVLLPMSSGSSIGRPDEHFAHDPSLSVADSVDCDSLLAIELDLEQEPHPQSSRVFCAIVDRTTASRVVTGRLDRDSTHLEALLTCGRLMI